MKLNIYQIDAFTDELFRGNPACVVPLEKWLSDDLMLKIAKENAVAETAFFIVNEDSIHLRWFTPDIEMDLCGHATLASAHALQTILDYPSDKMVFTTLSGELIVNATDGLYTMDFPSRMPEKTKLPLHISQALSIQPKLILKARDYVLVYDHASDVKNIIINRAKFDEINLDPGGVIVTAKGDESDFVSRFFTPQATALEDPVTGSAHCSLIPYWSKELAKSEMTAFQVSERGGKLFCENNGDRVLISGNARTYSRGEFWTE
jgi:PhzF family phenazine biosynthesis protein